MPTRHRRDTAGALSSVVSSRQTDIPAQIGGRLRRLSRSRSGLVEIVRRFSSSHGPDGLRILVRRLDVSVADIEAIRGDILREMESGKPTSEPPGTPAKVAEMRARVERGEAVFQADDAVVGLR